MKNGKSDNTKIREEKSLSKHNSKYHYDDKKRYKEDYKRSD